MIYLILFSSFFLTANAKTINRQAYKVCKSHEEAYWNGSSAECCDTTTHKLVKNYTNSIGENGYACCSIQENKDSSWTDSYGTTYTETIEYEIVGAVNGKCCGGQSYHLKSTASEGYLDRRTDKINHNILQNGGVYYCAANQVTTYQSNNDTTIISSVYESDSRWCQYTDGYLFECFCSDSGNPASGGYSC